MELINDLKTQQTIKNPYLWVEKGKEFMDKWNYEEAIQCFDQAIEIFPEHPIPYKLKAICQGNIKSVKKEDIK